MRKRTKFNIILAEKQRNFNAPAQKENRRKGTEINFEKVF
mgnify:CR=1 FL=1